MGSASILPRSNVLSKPGISTSIFVICLELSKTMLKVPPEPKRKSSPVEMNPPIPFTISVGSRLDLHVPLIFESMSVISVSVVGLFKVRSHERVRVLLFVGLYVKVPFKDALVSLLKVTVKSALPLFWSVVAVHASSLSSLRVIVTSYLSKTRGNFIKSPLTP